VPSSNGSCRPGHLNSTDSPAAVIDLWSRRVIGWSTGNSATTELVSQALVMAAPQGPARRAIHHSDRGAAYTSLAFSQRITELELHQSFGKTGDCYAAAEAFFATLKRELAWTCHTERWRTRDQLRSALSGYIEDFYNPERIQRRLGHRSPIDFERAVS
jgi:putative transposase